MIVFKKRSEKMKRKNPFMKDVALKLVSVFGTV